jgi:hypothetical protein
MTYTVRPAPCTATTTVSATMGLCHFAARPRVGAMWRNGRKTMAISKKTREEVYRKYDGHCAYCGREIAYKDMQVDHFLPLRAWGIEDAGTDDISNLMPSCRMCNHYKRANTLETFRRYIAEIPRKLRENYIYKVGVVYGNVIENEKPIEFYFEKQKSATHLEKGCENG